MESTITPERIKINVGTLQADGLFNLVDNATGECSYWFKMEELPEVKKLIKELKSNPNGETQLIKLIYCVDYSGFILRKNRFQHGYWCIDYIKIVDGEIKYESYIAQGKQKHKMGRLFSKLKDIKV